MISIKGIDKTYNTRGQITHALKNINLEIEPGEIFGIIGRNGSGKTTLARCFNLLERPNAGSITIGKCTVTALKEEELRFARQKIGYLSKQAELLNSRTVYDNVVLPLEFTNANKGDMQHIVTTILDSLDLTDKAHLYPSNLNAGQKQKVALARIMVHQPTVLICDDPGSQMDLKSSHAFTQLLRDLNEEIKLTIIYLTQELETLKTLCNRAAVLHQGELVEQGSLIKLFASPTANITKDLIKSNTRLELPLALRKRLRSNPGDSLNSVLRITFLGPSAQEPLIAHVIQQFGLTLHIIQAHLETIHAQTMGIMIVEMSGAQEGVQKTIEFLEGKGLFIEVLGYVPRLD